MQRPCDGERLSAFEECKEGQCGESGEECEDIRLGLAGHGYELGLTLKAAGGCCSILSSMI